MISIIPSESEKSIPVRMLENVRKLQRLPFRQKPAKMAETYLLTEQGGDTMAPKQNMRCSAAEENQKECFREFLKKEMDITNIKSQDTYISPLTARGALTKMLHDNKELDSAAESLLTMDNLKQIQTIAVWWRSAKAGLSSLHRTALKYCLLFHGVDPLLPIYNPNSISDSKPKMILQQPPHAVRPYFLIQNFFPGHIRSSMEKDFPVYEHLLSLLCGKDAVFLTEDSLRESTPAFQRFREDALLQIEHFFDETAARIVQNFSGVLRVSCQNILKQIRLQRALPILEDLERRKVPYDNSLLPCLADLRTACQQNAPERCAQALLVLFKRVLLDCAPETQWGGQLPALQDPRIWDDGVIWSWTDQSSLSGGEIKFFLRTPFPQQPDYRAHLAAALLYNMSQLASEPGKKGSPETWKQADVWMETAVVFCGRYWADLYPALLRPPAKCFSQIPELLLLGDVNGSVYYAELLQQQAQLLLHMPVDGKTKSEQSIQLIRAQNALRQSLFILQKRIDDRQELLEIITKERHVRLWLAKGSLHAAECCRRFAVLEENETCLTDVLEMYIRPCRDFLTNPEAFSYLSEDEIKKIQTDRTHVCQDCFDTFFGADSDFTGRLRLQPGMDDSSYRAEYQVWLNSPGLLLSPPPDGAQAPSVHLPLDPEQLRNLERFKPVYSGVFDSVLGKDPAQKRPLELALFQLLGSSQTSLLQMNQVVDNLAMLQMFHIPGFQAACRAGLVTLSCYGEVHTPKTYLERNLQNPNFLFSCSQAFQLPPDLSEEEQERTIRTGARGVMVRYLNGQASLQEFPSVCDRQEMEFLAESWKIAFECFQHSDLRRYHQNEMYRFPPRKRKPPYTTGMLSSVVQERLRLLIQEAEQPGSHKNLHRLLAMQDYYQKYYQNQIGTQPGRSEFTAAADRLAQQYSDSVLEDLRTIIHQCYFLYNGSLCCDHILLTASDPDFVPLSDPTHDFMPQAEYMNSSSSPTTEYVYRQAWKPGTLENIGWPDICDIALISRELDLKSGTQSNEQRLAQKETEIGLGYYLQKDDFLLMDYTAELSSKERVHVCASEELEETHFMEMNTKN